MANKSNKRRSKSDSPEDNHATKSTRRKKYKRKAKRHFDKDALRGIMDGTVDVDKYQQYVDDNEH